MATIPPTAAIPVVSDRDDHLDAALKAVIDRLDFDCVIDVGASYGQFHGLMRTLGYEGRIVSFEPVARPFEHCQQWALDDPAWEVYRLAVGRRNGHRRIKVGSSDDFSSFLDLSAYGLALFDTLEVAGEEEVEVRTLDSLWPELFAGARKVFLKTDTQGWDMEVFKGARRHLKQVVGVQCELSVQALYNNTPSYRKTLAYLERKGFDLTGLYVVCRDDFNRVIEFDSVMIRPEAMTHPA